MQVLTMQVATSTTTRPTWAPTGAVIDTLTSLPGRLEVEQQLTAVRVFYFEAKNITILAGTRDRLEVRDSWKHAAKALWARPDENTGKVFVRFDHIVSETPVSTSSSLKRESRWLELQDFLRDFPRAVSPFCYPFETWRWVCRTCWPDFDNQEDEPELEYFPPGVADATHHHTVLDLSRTLRGAITEAGIKACFANVHG